MHQEGNGFFELADATRAMQRCPAFETLFGRVTPRIDRYFRQAVCDDFSGNANGLF
ncbi:hypothetical protein EVA_06106 [gut metagenome]|uniref:Uncharacterized protein n=1 Tax=gut metagenome TaxID=749906 RepID=J9CZS6_9ZZZZ